MFAAALAFFALLAPRAGAAQVSSVLGIPCTTQANGVQACIGDTAHRVKSWDGVPLDVNIWLPPASQNGPFPLLAYHHGWGGNKGGSGADPNRALDGYAVLSYTARGFGESCGSAASRAADPAGCARGWIHLDDARYEARDTQTLAGRLADLKLVKSHRIGVTGTSYGGGTSFILAGLKNRIMLPDGTLKRWRSPNGKKMKIRAAVPLWGWSDLAESLMPAGNTLDYLVDNPYGQRIGVAKQYQGLLYSVGAGSGFYAPPGGSPDITGWFARIQQGEPYDDALSRSILQEIQQYHSAYYIQTLIQRRKQVRPAPILAYNSWIDDLFYADEPLRYRTLVKDRFPRAEFSLLFAAAAGHPRAGGPSPTELAAQTNEFFDRHLKGFAGRPLGIRTYTQACNGSPLMGPFDTRSWRAQTPGEVRASSPAPQTFTSAGGDPAVAAAVSVLSPACNTRPATVEPNTATYNLPTAIGNGYTMIGSPTVSARLAVSSSNAQIAARIWDVAPDGTQSFITRGALRPQAGTNRVVFQLHAQGWHFAPGHFPRIQLLGRDVPYQRASNGTFSITASEVQIRLPVRQLPTAAQVQRPLAPLDRDGSIARRHELAGS